MMRDLLLFILLHWQGRNVDSLGHCGSTVLFLACRGGHINLANNLLRKYQCKKYALDNMGGLASTCAAFYGHTHLLQMLIDEFKFSPTSVRLTDGQNLLHQACGGKHYETANILITKYQLVPTTCSG
jgi:ankyrin repeat protein